MGHHETNSDGWTGQDYVSDALIVLFDIVGFSRKPEDPQRWMIEQLWKVINLQLRALKRTGGRLVNCTGDGALLVFPRTNRAATEDQVVALALEVAHGMSTGKGRAAIRIALHRTRTVTPRLAYYFSE